MASIAVGCDLITLNSGDCSNAEANSSCWLARRGVLEERYRARGRTNGLVLSAEVSTRESVLNERLMDLEQWRMNMSEELGRALE